MRVERPKWALVLWSDGPLVPCCISLESVPDAVARGAVVLAREDAELMQQVSVEWNPQSNPRRTEDGDDGA